MAHVLSPRIRCRSSLVLFPSYVCDKHKHDPVQKTTQHSWKQCHHIPYLQHLDGLVDDGNCEAQKLETLLQPRLRLSLAFCSGQCPRDSVEATRNGIRTRRIKNKHDNYLDTPHLASNPMARLELPRERVSPSMWSVANIYHLPSGNHMRATQGLNIVDLAQNTTSSRRKQPIWKLHQYVTVSF